ncbi:hypothetical protein V2J09_000501 [Rumex salicifolius]
MLTAMRSAVVLKTSIAVIMVWLQVQVEGGGGGNLNKEVDISWGDGHGSIVDNGRLLTLSLDEESGSGFRSKNHFLFGRIHMRLKLLSSEGEKHDEIDFEFLGNVTGEPYIVHTNIYVEGKGNREQQFYVWFDPTSKFHTYTLLWNPLAIIIEINSIWCASFYVDNIPIRVFKNMIEAGVPFPEMQPMRVYGSIWNADDWATQGGRIKTNWTEAPFTASFAGFRSSTTSSYTNITTAKKGDRHQDWYSQVLDSPAQEKLNWVRQNYKVYDCCMDVTRFPLGLPRECVLTN